MKNPNLKEALIQNQKQIDLLSAILSLCKSTRDILREEYENTIVINPECIEQLPASKSSEDV